MSTVLNTIYERFSRPDLAPRSAAYILAFVAITAALAAVCLWLGPYPITKYPEDTLYFLMQGDLLRKGYSPGVDFHSMHGPFPSLFTSVAMRLHGVSLDSVILSQVLGAITFGCMMFRIASGRLNGFWSVFLAIAIELILLSCTPIGSKTWREFTCAMWYNSIGYCIFAIVFLYLLAPSRRTAWFDSAIDDAIIAFAIAACLLTKYSYFLPLATTFVVGSVILPRTPLTRTRGVLILAMGVATALAISYALGASLSAPYGMVESLALKVSPVATTLRFVHYTRTIGTFLLGFALLAWLAAEAGIARAMLREALLVALMLGTLLVSAGTSAQDLEILPMAGVVLLGLTTLVIKFARQAGDSANKYLVIPTLGIAFLLVIHEPKNSILSWIFSHTKVVKTLGDPVELYSASDAEEINEFLADDVDHELFAMMPKDWLTPQLEGVSLLQKAGVEQTDVVFVAADVSPINMLTDTAYPSGIMTWWPSRFVSGPESSSLIGKELFSDVDYVLQRRASNVFWQFLMFHRGDYFRKNFEEIGEDSHWVLYGRRERSASP